MANTNATDATTRRNVLEATGGLLAGATALAGLGAGRGAAAIEEELQFEVRELTEEYIAVEMRISQATFDEIKPSNDIFLGPADRFIDPDEEAAVSLPEDTEGLANPVEITPIESATSHGNLMYFRTGDIDWPNEYEKEEVTLGLGVFPERTIGDVNWNTDDVGVVRGPSDADG